MSEDLARGYEFRFAERSYRLMAEPKGAWTLYIDDVPTERLKTRDDVLASALAHAVTVGSEKNAAYREMRRIENWAAIPIDIGGEDLTK